MRRVDQHELHAIITRNKERLCRKKHVVGIGGGLKSVGGSVTNDLAIVVYTDNKLSKSCLHPNDVIEQAIDGVQTDVVQVGKIQIQPLVIKAQSVYGRRERPIPCGVSIGHMSVTAGTLGGYFLDKDNQVVLLSNQHVIAGEKFVGPHGPAPLKGNVILQPGVFDGGNLGDVFAHLKEWVPLRPKGNVEDSGIATIDNVKDAVNEVKGLGRIRDFGSVHIGLDVQKVGRSTGHTKGKVISINAFVCVEYDKGVTRCFDNCIVTTNMSEGGDSGSLLLDMDMKAVGLLFAGSEAVTIYNPITYPVNTYGLKIWR